MKFLQYLFSYVPPESLPEVPEEEPTDPAEGRVLTDTFRAARRNLIVICALCIAWASAQISVGSPSISLAGLSLDLSNATVPLVLTLSLAYLTFQWGLEFAMMSRKVRRWRLAHLDFRIVSRIVRFALLAIAAGVMQRSLATITYLVCGLFVLALISGLFSIVLIFVFMPLRMWARSKANRPSAANAAFEAVTWAAFFSVILIVAGVIAAGVAAYRYEPLRNIIWDTPPNPLAFGAFIFALVATLLSEWLLTPLFAKLFAQRPDYHTRRGEDGRVVYTFKNDPQEPLL